MPALAFAIELLDTIPSLIGAGVDVIDLVTRGNDSLKSMKEESRDPSDAEWAELHRTIEDLRALRPDITIEEV